MRTRDLALIAMFAALLIGVQFALSFVAGIELVSMVLLTFSAVFGWKRGMITAVVFCLLRCIIFGAVPSVLVLYLLYYPFYALVCAFCGKIKTFWRRYAVLITAAVLMTISFTLLDDVITPLMMSFNKKAWLMYFYASTPVMLTQTICSAVSVAALYPPLSKLLEKLKISYFDNYGYNGVA